MIFMSSPSFSSDGNTVSKEALGRFRSSSNGGVPKPDVLGDDIVWPLSDFVEWDVSEIIAKISFASREREY